MQGLIAYVHRGNGNDSILLIKKNLSYILNLLQHICLTFYVVAISFISNMHVNVRQ